MNIKFSADVKRSPIPISSLQNKQAAWYDNGVRYLVIKCDNFLIFLNPASSAYLCIVDYHKDSFYNNRLCTPVKDFTIDVSVVDEGGYDLNNT